MTQNRRRAWRLTLGGAGWLAAEGFRVACTVENISVLGAKVVVESVLVNDLEPVPEEVTLTMVLGGEQVSVNGEILRVQQDDGGLTLGICFFDGESAGLGWLINQAQRASTGRSGQAAGGRTAGAPAWTSASGITTDPSSR